MSFLRKLRQDELLRRVLHNSTHLLSSNSISLVISVGQSILAARLLAPAGFGLVGIVMAYASTVNGLLSFRMSELVVRYGGNYLERGEKKKAAALIKAAGLAESAVSVLAFLVVAATAGFASRFIAKTPGTEWMLYFYGLGLLANFTSETSTGVLQITDKIRMRGTINLFQAAVSGAVILVVYGLTSWGILHGSLILVAVLAAYLVGKTILGIALFLSARAQLLRLLGNEWHRASLSLLPAYRELFGFAFSSNLSATAILVFRESELLWVGYFLNNEAAGLYKIAYTIVGFLSVPADPLILSVYPETNRLIAQSAWQRLRNFLRSVTLLSLSYNLLVVLGIVFLGRWILAIFGDPFVPAFPAMMVLLTGMAFNYILFWNRPLLLSFGLQTFALSSILIAGAIKTTLAFALVPRFGYVMQAGLLSLFYVLSVSLNVWRGLKELRHLNVSGAVWRQGRSLANGDKD